MQEVLVTGSRTGLADFKHYADKHRPDIAKHIVAYETVDHPTQGQLLALARQFFLKHDRMAGCRRRPEPAAVIRAKPQGFATCHTFVEPPVLSPGFWSLIQK